MQPQKEGSSRSVTSPGLPPTKGGGNMSLARLDAQSAISRGQRAAAAAGKKNHRDEEKQMQQISSTSACIAAGVIRSSSQSHLGVSQGGKSRKGRQMSASRRSSASVSRMNSMQAPERKPELQRTPFATPFPPGLQEVCIDFLTPSCGLTYSFPNIAQPI